MNRKIKELAIEAGITTNIDTDYFEGDMNLWIDRYSEIFANLLLKECIQVLIDNGYPNAHKEYVGVDHIKKHFDITT